MGWVWVMRGLVVGWVWDTVGKGWSGFGQGVSRVLVLGGLGVGKELTRFNLNVI